MNWIKSYFPWEAQAIRTKSFDPQWISLCNWAEFIPQRRKLKTNLNYRRKKKNTKTDDGRVCADWSSFAASSLCFYIQLYGFQNIPLNNCFTENLTFPQVCSGPDFDLSSRHLRVRICQNLKHESCRSLRDLSRHIKIVKFGLRMSEIWFF